MGANPGHSVCIPAVVLVAANSPYIGRAVSENTQSVMTSDGRALL